MGWMFQNQKLRHETPQDHLTRKLTTPDTGDSRQTVLAAATVAGTVYAAVREHTKSTDSAFVFCVVILFRNTIKLEFGYKLMDETCGPYEVACPDRIMRLLSPIADIPSPGCAGDWRERVKAHQARRMMARRIEQNLRSGDIVALPSATTLGTFGIVGKRFRFIQRDNKTLAFEPVDRPGLRCRLTKAQLGAASLEAETNSSHG